MTSQQVHLVRHGEVYNPDQVLYGRQDSSTTGPGWWPPAIDREPVLRNASI